MKGQHWITIGSLALALVAAQLPAFAQNDDVGGGGVRETARPAPRPTRHSGRPPRHPRGPQRPSA